MGTTSVSSQTSTPTATEEEKGMEKIQLGQYQQYAPAQTQMYQSAFGLGNQLLSSFGDQSGQQWQSLIGGVTKEQQQSMINEQDRYLQPQLQQQGIYDSGTAATARLRAATDLSNQNAQFNVGTLQNALNLALGGQAQIQNTSLTQTSQLGQQLAGLRSNQTTGYNSQNTTSLGILGNWCWVAAELYNGWDEPKTCAVRFYIGHLAPKWFKNFYIKYGERIAKFIHNKPILKAMLRPLFNHFVSVTLKEVYNGIRI